MAFLNTLTFPSPTPAEISQQELGYIDGLTSNAQAQLNAKLPLAGGTLTGGLLLPRIEIPAGNTTAGANAERWIGPVSGIATATQINVPSGGYLALSHNGVNQALVGNGYFSASTIFPLSSADNLSIKCATADGTDNRLASLSGGGAVVAPGSAQTRGAGLESAGNEHATRPGQLSLMAGGVTGGKVVVYDKDATARLQVDESGLTLSAGGKLSSRLIEVPSDNQPTPTAANYQEYIATYAWTRNAPGTNGSHMLLCNAANRFAATNTANAAYSTLTYGPIAGYPGTQIVTTTADAADEWMTQITGGGAVIAAGSLQTRSGAAEYSGNEHPTRPGQVSLLSGAVTGGKIAAYDKNAAIQMQIDENGVTQLKGQRTPALAKTASYTATVGESLITCNHATVSVVITLPAATGSGQRYTIANIGAAAASCARAGSDLIAGQTSISIAQWSTLVVIDVAAGIWISA